MLYQMIRFLLSCSMTIAYPDSIGWRDKWAVRFQYQGPKDKAQTLFLIFEQPGSQAAFVDLIRKSGFMIETGAEVM